MSMQPIWRGLFEPLEARILLSADRAWVPDLVSLGDLASETAPPAVVVAPPQIVTSRSFDPPTSNLVRPTDQIDASPVAVAADRVGSTIKTPITRRALVKPVASRVVLDGTSSVGNEGRFGNERRGEDRRAGIASIRLVTALTPRTIVSPVASSDRSVRPAVAKTLSNDLVRIAALRSSELVKTIRTRFTVVLDKVSPRIKIKTLALPRISEPSQIGADATQTKLHPTVPEGIQTAITGRPAPGGEPSVLWWMPESTSHHDALATGDEVETAVYDESQSRPDSGPVRTATAGPHASEWSFRSAHGGRMADGVVDGEPLIAHRMGTTVDGAELAATEDEVQETCVTQAAGTLLTVTFGNPLSRLIGAIRGGQEGGPDAPLALAPIPPTPSRRRRRVSGGKRRATKKETGDDTTASVMATTKAVPAAETRAPESVVKEARNPTRPSAISPRSADVAFGFLGRRIIDVAQIPRVDQQARHSSAAHAGWNGTAWQLGVGSLAGSIGWLALERCRSGQGSCQPTRPTRLACTGPTHDGSLAIG